MKTQLLLIITLFLTTTLPAQDVLLYESFADETLVYSRHNANGGVRFYGAQYATGYRTAGAGKWQF